MLAPSPAMLRPSPVKPVNDSSDEELAVIDPLVTRIGSAWVIVGTINRKSAPSGTADAGFNKSIANLPARRMQSIVPEPLPKDG
jgi:hypothetical protein